MFVGRKEELAKLEQAYRHDGFSAFIVFGPDGAGKTTLLEEFCKDKDAIFFTASRISSRANLSRFSYKVLKHYHDEGHEPLAFWDNAFSYIEAKQIEKPEGSARLVIVLDDFSEIAAHDVAFMDVLQNSIGKILRDSDIFMVLTSSNASFVRSNLLNKESFLSRRLSGGLDLKRFTLTDEAVRHMTEEAAKYSDGVDAKKFVKFSADDVILREGEANSGMYKIISGRALCYLGYGTDDEYPVGTLKENRTFGEYSMLTGKPGIYTVVAFTDVLALRIGRGEFTKFIEMNASNAVEIMKNMAGMINVLKVNIDMLRKESEGES